MTFTAPGFDLASFLPYRLAAAAAKVSAEFATHYARKFDLSVAEWRVLIHLNQESRVSVRELHQRVNLDKSKVSRAASRLELRKLIRKVEHAEDRRLVDLSLTAKGQAMVQKIVPLALDFEAEMRARLSARQSAALGEALDILMGAKRSGGKR